MPDTARATPAASLPRDAKPSYAQIGEDLILQRIFRRVLKYPRRQSGFYLDIGAFHPSQESTTRLLYDQGWQGIVVDISAASIAAFQAQRPRDTAVCAAVSDAPGEITAYFHADTSVVNTCNPAHVAAQRAAGRVIEERQVPALTLDQLLAAHAPEVTRIDYLNIDVEGFELKVLQGLDFARHAPVVISVEQHTGNLLRFAKSDVAKFLFARDYVWVASAVITHFFVRKPGPEAG